MKNYYYTYYSYEEWGRGYIGRRGCDCLPEEDVKYFGSFTDKTFKPTQKIILQIFNTLEEAAKAEVILHNFYQVHINPHFANRAKSTSIGFFFDFTGIIRSKETREKMSNSTKGRTMSEETRLKISKTKKGKYTGKANPNYGNKWNNEQRTNLSVYRKQFVGPKNNMYGKKREDLAEYNRKPKRWVTNKQKDKLILREELQKYLDMGYVIGRTFANCKKN